jgi:hypothetical protein
MSSAARRSGSSASAEPDEVDRKGLAASGAGSKIAAMSQREEGFHFNLVAAWPPPDPEREGHVAWVRESWELLRPYGEGVYANFISDEGDAGVKAAFGERLARLVALKDRYDPANFFRLNANVAPSHGGAR